MHFLSLLLLLHVQRRYTAGIARWLLQNNARTVHIKPQKLNRLMSPLIVMMRRMLVMTRRRRSLSRAGRRLLSCGKVSLSGTLRSRTEQSKHGRLEQALVRTRQTPTTQSRCRRHLSGHQGQLRSTDGRRLQPHTGPGRRRENSPVRDLAFFSLHRLIVHLLASAVTVMGRGLRRRRLVMPRSGPGRRHRVHGATARIASLFLDHDRLRRAALLLRRTAQAGARTRHRLGLQRQVVRLDRSCDRRWLDDCGWPEKGRDVTGGRDRRVEIAGLGVTLGLGVGILGGLVQVRVGRVVTGGRCAQ